MIEEAYNRLKELVNQCKTPVLSLIHIYITHWLIYGKIISNKYNY